MKKMALLAKAACVSLMALTAFVSCSTQDADEFTPQVDNGIQISSIALSRTSVELTGMRKQTSITLTATASPSYATDTTLTWASSDPAIASVTADDSDSTVATVTLEGAGNAVITASNAAGTVHAECAVTCLLETTPPLAVSNVTPTANGNNVYFTWTDPTDYDSDLDHILIATADGAHTAEVAAGVQYGWVQGLAAGTEYSFKLTAVDANGNTSDSVTVAATTQDTVSETAPAAASGLDVAENGGETISFSWTASADAAYQKLVITALDGGSVPTSLSASAHEKALVTETTDTAVTFLLPDNTTTAASATGFETGKAYKAELYALSADFVASETAVDCEVTAAPAVTGVAATIKYTGSIIVTWTDYADETYKYVAVATDGASSTVTSSLIEAGTQKAHLTGLTAGTAYSVTVKTYSGNTALAESAAITITPKTVIWQIVNTYNTSYIFAPYITDTLDYKNVCTVAAGSTWKYPYWIVRSSLSTPEDSETFSLESSESASLSGASGLYLCIDNVQSFGSDASGWGYPASSHSYHAYSLATDVIEDHMGSLDYASFKLLPSSVSATEGWSAWYVWQVGSTGRYLYDTYLNVSGETSYTASSGDYVFAYQETVVE